MTTNQEDRNTSPSLGSDFSGVVLDFLGCSYRATIRLFKGLPNRFKAYVKRKIKEYRNRPKRTDINRVYVVVGYTTKKRVDEKFNAGRRMMIIRRGLLVLIFLLIIFIAVNRFTELINYGELSQIFGVNSFDEVVENDPFADRTTQTTTIAVTEMSETT